MITIIAEQGARTRIMYKEELVFINSFFCETYIFLAILHEYGHWVTHDKEATEVMNEVLAWDWVKDNMGDFPIGEYERIRNERLAFRIDLVNDSWIIGA